MEQEDFKRKRWRVTYTKHIKQKRKVYLDGFLHLHVITNKVMLFDDGDKLLECRILKDEDAIAPGETLSFNTYLVDVGDPEGGNDDKQKPASDSKVHERYSKFSEMPKPGLSRRRKFRSPSISSDGKDKKDEINVHTRNLSPSEKMIREFKRSELQRYSGPQRSSGILTPGVTEWQVLYTTQMTQKAKKFHDGFLQISNSGSIGRQVVLHDASRKFLTSRFLKKDEIVQSGESVLFDSHLVEIGEPERDHKTFVGLTNQQYNGTKDGETKGMHEQNSCLKSAISVEEARLKNSEPECETSQSCAEWQVMYTTQVTQKAKKYHDGFVRLLCSGSLGRQIMLYDARKKLIDSRFLKKAETISSGESIAFQAHLVDIGEPEGGKQTVGDLNVERINSSDVGKAGMMQRRQSCLTANKSVASSICTISTTKLNNVVPMDKPLRDACQILSILQKAIVKGSATAEGTDKNILEPAFSVKGLKVSDAAMAHPEASQFPGQSNDGSSKNVDNEGSGEKMHVPRSPRVNSLEAKVSFSSNQLLEDTETGLSDQCHHMEDTEGCGEGFASELSGLSNTSSCSSFDDKNKRLEHLKSERQMDEWPSFDLGF